MAHAVREQRFLDYTEHTQDPHARHVIAGYHDDTIQREMRRRGAWREGLRLLDIGCGLGLSAEYWHSRGFRVTGVDRDADLIARARERAAQAGHSIRYETGLAERLPFPDQSFDIVYANSLLEHVPHWEPSVEEWIRVLAPDGLLWVETTNVLCPKQGEFRWLPVYSWWPGFMKRVVVKLALGPCPALANYSAWPAIHWFSFFQLQRFLTPRGLSVRDRFDAMDLSRAGPAKRWVRNVARSCPAGRWLAYLLVTPLIVLATKPPDRPVSSQRPTLASPGGMVC